MTMWNEFGFRTNLYDTQPIHGNDEGEVLLVGRKKELRIIKNRISNFNSVVTVEGPNGVGKTSLILVAAHQLEKDTQKKGKSSLVLLPKPLQFTREDSAFEFKRKVYAKIASYFIDNEKQLAKRLDLQFALRPLRDWLENPLFTELGGQVMGYGASMGKSPNTSTSFDFHGFFDIVERLLKAAFTDQGGIICVLDNLEILNTSKKAQEHLEALRDDLFSIHGVRWVVCGARGIVKSVASTSRLQGRLSDPLEVKPLPKSEIPKLIQARVDTFKKNGTATPPVGADSFVHIFSVLNENLRDSLKFAGDFSAWIFEEDKYVPVSNELHELFEIWLAEKADEYAEQVQIPPRAWTLFDDITARGGVVSPSSFEDFNFNTSQNMRGQVAKLEEAGLVSSEISDHDKRRKNIRVLPKGWIVNYKRCGYAI